MTWPDEAELLPDFVPTGGLTVLAGQVGAGKSWLALDLHMALAEAGVLVQEITLISVMLEFGHAFEEIQAASDVTHAK